MQAALADDFDTARAVDAVMGLIHHGNRQLKAATQVTPGMRPDRVVWPPSGGTDATLPSPWGDFLSHSWWLPGLS